MDPALPITVRVDYRLGEYLRLVRARAFATPRLAHCTPREKSLYVALITLVCTGLFFHKRWRLGTCDFTIDEAGVTRRSKGGKLTHLAWSEITGVRTQPVGFLFEKGQGGMPVPYRLLDAGQRTAIAALVSRHVARRAGPESTTASLAATVNADG